jgi:hypothetical protein
VATTADRPTGGAEQDEDEPDNDQDDADRPEDRDRQDEPEDKTDDAESDHERFLTLLRSPSGYAA